MSDKDNKRKKPYISQLKNRDCQGVLKQQNETYSDSSIKCLIECQDERHFKPVDEFGGKSQFEIQKKNDELKRIYAEKHNIPLYEIPYTSKKYENVELFLKSKKII